MSIEKIEKPGRKNLRKGILRITREADKAVYFHKFFSKVYGDNQTTEYALLEFLNGSLITVDIENSNFRFCSEKEFIECLPEEHLLMAIKNSTEDSVEDRSMIVKQIMDYSPTISDIPKYEEKGYGHWKEGVVSGWKWNVKGLLLNESNVLDHILQDLQLDKIYSENK